MLQMMIEDVVREIANAWPAILWAAAVAVAICWRR